MTARRRRGIRPAGLFWQRGDQDAGPNPLLVPCPFCGAGERGACRRLRGGDYHQSRKDAAVVNAGCKNNPCGWPECDCFRRLRQAAR